MSKNMLKISFEIAEEKFDVLRSIINQECDDVIADEDIVRMLFLVENFAGEDIDLRDDIENVQIENGHSNHFST